MNPARFHTVGFLCIAWTTLQCSSPVSAWDEEGHVVVTRLAHSRLPERMPAWVRTMEVRQRLEYLSAEPDRWRGQKNVHLDHINNPDHYIDIEDLEVYGLTLRTLPPLRREFLDVLAAQRALKPDKFPPYDREKDKSYSYNIPGLLPWEIAELQWKLAASWTQLKTYEQHREHVSETAIRNARENIVYQMGILSHFVGDGSQPLHTTRHHHGWVGPNPRGYTTEKSFHQRIDGGVIDHHRITAEALLDRARPPRKVSQEAYWEDICAYLGETFEKVEPLYALEKSGELDKAAGRQFIEECLLEGGSMLAGVWVAAYDGARIDEFRVNRLMGEKARSARQKQAAGKRGTPTDTAR